MAGVINLLLAPPCFHEVIFVPAGELHNLTNAGQDDLKLLAIYAPAEYLEDSVCRTQEEAQAARRETLE